MKYLRVVALFVAVSLFLPITLSVSAEQIEDYSANQESTENTPDEISNNETYSETTPLGSGDSATTPTEQPGGDSGSGDTTTPTEQPGGDSDSGDDETSSSDETEGDSGEENTDPTISSSPDTDEVIVRISAYDSLGQRVKTPSGNCGEAVDVMIPLICTGGSISDLSISPVLSEDLNEYPFVIDMMDYTLKHPTVVADGEIVDFLYQFTLHDMVTAGVKKVQFKEG